MAEDEKIVSYEAGWMQLGFTMMPNVVLLNSSLSTGARLLYGTLAYYARQSDKAWPGQERIAVSMGVSERSVRSYTRELVDADLVSVTSRHASAGARMSNLYRLLNPSAEMVAEVQRQILPPSPAESAGNHRQDLPLKKTQGEEEAREEEHLGTGAVPGGDGQLFGDPSPASVPSPPSPAAVSAPDPIDAAVDRLWDHWLGYFKDRHRKLDLTPPRRAMFTKGLKAVGGGDDLATAEQICLDAIDGFKSWIDEHPRAPVDPSKVFQTKPGGKNLTDQVESWSMRVQEKRATSGGSANLVDHHPLIRDKVRRYRIQVVQMYQSPELESARERGEAALVWLREQAHEEPVIEEGQVKTWRKIES